MRRAVASSLIKRHFVWVAPSRATNTQAVHLLSTPFMYPLVAVNKADGTMNGGDTLRACVTLNKDSFRSRSLHLKQPTRARTLTKGAHLPYLTP